MVHHFSDRLRIASVIVLAAALVAAVSAFAQQDSTTTEPAPNQMEVTKEQLGAIEKEITSLRDEAGRLASKENSIMATLDQYQVEVLVKEREIEWYDLRARKAEQDIQDLESHFQQQKADLQTQKTYLSARLVDAYKLGQMNYLKMMLKVDSASDLLRTYQYVSFLAKDDQRRLEEYKKSIQGTEDTRKRLEQENVNLVSLRKDSEQAKADLLRNRNEKLRLLSAIQTQREMHLNTLTELKAAAGELQNFFRAEEPLPVEPDAVSMDHYRGLLEWPVLGKVLGEFGVQKHPVFGTTTMHNGIDIQAEEGSSVKAVFGGQVIFAEWFKGYGNSIIIAHAGGFHTLYAHNSELMVQRGDTVQRGQVIARSGSTGSLIGSSLYFELRDKEQAVNPRLWLKRY